MEKTLYYNKQKPSYDAWDEIRPALLEKLEAGGMVHEDCVSFLVAAEEIYVNIAMHGYPDGVTEDDFCETALLLRENEKGKAAVIIFRDNGMSFDPLQMPEREPLTTVRGVKPGGFGIAMAREKTDEMEYSREGECNRLSMIKCF
jgi:anti-sigma regulatory factor (Ser/Thr protein kinase)